MNFREELVKVRQEHRFSVESKANRFLFDALVELRKKPFYEDEKLALFATRDKIILKLVDGPDIFKAWFINSVEADVVFDLIVKKLKNDGCRVNNPNSYRHFVILED
ncbi:MAG: hypothetical protein ACI4VH_04260 [Clostridia bacterium]